MKSLNTLAGAMLASTLFAGSALAQTELTMWYHGAGSESEMALVNAMLDEFNASQSDWKVVITTFPQIAYNDSVVAAALAGTLPDIIDIDGPILPNWAWAGYIQPLAIDETLIANYLPGPKGVWDDKLYGIGMWDAAVSLVTRQSYLDELGLRTPTLDEPWTGEEFQAALDAAKNSGKFEYALDLGMAWNGEWFPYAFSPFLQSFGGDMIDRSTYLTAEGVLNGEAGIAFGNWWQSLFTGGYAQATQDPADRDSGFANGKYAFSWNGNWAALGALAAFDDVVFLPAPDFGNGPTIGAASWQLSISSTSQHPEGANAFINFALNPDNLARFSKGLGLIPATAEAAALTENYQPGGPLEVFYELSNRQGLLRPVTPGYPVMAKVFEKALADIANGANVEETLDAAVDEIDADIEANGGYGFK
ncbi:MAG: extracellular solute-binding protein [Rhodobacterales bacterium]|jgi:multiple sugar transport system substrate-binding protein|nr:extracellular solute-binding protein [Rhodobacterales bacterium]